MSGFNQNSPLRHSSKYDFASFIADIDHLPLKAINTGIGLQSGPNFSSNTAREEFPTHELGASPSADISQMIASMRSPELPLAAPQIAAQPVTSSFAPYDSRARNLNINLWQKTVRVVLVHLADLFLIFTMFSLAFAVVTLLMFINQQDFSFGLIAKWEPVKFLLERNSLQLVIAFYAIYGIYWLIFRFVNGGTMANTLWQIQSRNDRV